jgi:glutathione synthase/RimK-type ligase-like ATP-grasp enzyme
MKKSNLNILSESAKRIGLKTEWLVNTSSQKILLVSDTKKFYLASGKAPGFYPLSKRFNAVMSNNKLIAQNILKRLNYKVIESTKIIISEHKSFAEFWSNLKTKGYKYPVLVKPNKGLWGKGITIAENELELMKTLRQHFKEHSDCMVQPILNEKEYRIMVLNDEVVLMHSKHNPHIVGDGKSTIKELLDQVATWRKNDVYIKWQHKKLKTTQKTILELGQKFDYHLTKIPTAIYYETFKSKKIPKAVERWALKLAKDIDSSVVGIDVFIPGNFTQVKDFVIIELNSNPGLDYLITHCHDPITPYEIFDKVLNNYFSK